MSQDCVIVLHAGQQRETLSQKKKGFGEGRAPRTARACPKNSKGKGLEVGVGWHGGSFKWLEWNGSGGEWEEAEWEEALWAQAMLLGV